MKKNYYGKPLNNFLNVFYGYFNNYFNKSNEMLMRKLT